MLVHVGLTALTALAGVPGLLAANVVADPDHASVTVPAEVWRALLDENRELRTQLASQQEQIDALRQRFDAMEQATAPRTFAPVEPAAAIPPEWTPAPPPQRNTERVIISGEGAVGFFAGRDAHASPNEEFRVDEARLFVEAEITRNLYLFSELNLATREAPDEFFRLGECYLEFAELPSPWPGETLTFRAGRFDVPFGEEYQHRDVMANPLITHSVADLWGVDEGLELFGRAGAFDYTFAIQNGGHDPRHDFDGDKALIARLGLRPARSWRVSVSGMQTGQLDAADDGLSELWIGGGFFRAIGDSATTTSFSAKLAQLDASHFWNGGYFRGAFGGAWYEDNDPTADNQRELRFFHLELSQELREDVYGAVRFSRLDAPDGYPIAGLGSFSRYFFSPNLTEHLWRLGLGLGYAPTDNFRLKFEYTWERGRLASGLPRMETDQFAAEAGVKF